MGCVISPGILQDLNMLGHKNLNGMEIFFDLRRILRIGEGYEDHIKLSPLKASNL